MAVLVTADVPGQTPEGYDGMLAGLEPLIRQAKGFIAHGGGPSGDSWQIFEVWETSADATELLREVRAAEPAARREAEANIPGAAPPGVAVAPARSRRS